jgi:hypothetical protein
VHSQLINLTLIDVMDAQALYLLRRVTPKGTMFQLRSLGIQLSTGSTNVMTAQGSKYYEDIHGRVFEASMDDRYFDANYLAILHKAAPNVEELELFGRSDVTTIVRRNTILPF